MDLGKALLKTWMHHQFFVNQKMTKFIYTSDRAKCVLDELDVRHLWYSLKNYFLTDRSLIMKKSLKLSKNGRNTWKYAWITCTSKQLMKKLKHINCLGVLKVFHRRLSLGNLCHLPHLKCSLAVITHTIFCSCLAGWFPRMNGKT